jgi:hypothetical protein
VGRDGEGYIGDLGEASREISENQKFYSRSSTQFRKAIAYFRTFSAANVGADEDSGKRQGGHRGPMPNGKSERSLRSSATLMCPVQTC